MSLFISIALWRVKPNEPINRTRHGIPPLGVISFSPSAGLPRRAGYRRR